jgi:hypothetical protein
VIEAKEAVVWTNTTTREVRVDVFGSEPGSLWGDPIGAHYAPWQKMTNDQRAGLMTETALDLAMQGFDLGTVLREFAKVDAFRALGNASIPMCCALTKAMVGRSLEPNTMTFEELLDTHKGQW